MKLPGRFKVSPQVAGAIKAIPGVVEVRGAIGSSAGGDCNLTGPKGIASSRFASISAMPPLK